MTAEFDAAFDRLSSTQRRAVEWETGPALVLAGPGVGKTTVLTLRIARILEATKAKNFRILALTFTTKAGDEMRTRVETLVPGLSDRTVIGTFHSFCAQILRQHGSHLDIKPDFGIYDQDEDRTELLRDALESARNSGVSVHPDDARLLGVIDQLRSSLVSAEKTPKHFADDRYGERVARVYSVYERALREHNIMDFNGMILDTCRLAHKIPAVAARIRQSYPYWLIDEFQDTTPAQYRLIRFLAGDDFKNIFAVADDDQIIYQWAGASYRQLTLFQQHFAPALIQLVENHRCPPEIVDAANNLISHNSQRTPNKDRLISTLPAKGPAIRLRTSETDADEAEALAEELANAPEKVRGETAVLARTRSTLQPFLQALKARSVAASIATRRDRFVSPQFVWLQACLDQALRPTDRQVFKGMAGAANRISGMQLDAALLAAEADASGKTYLEHWAGVAGQTDNSVLTQLSEFGLSLVRSRAGWQKVMSSALAWLPTTVDVPDGVVSDADEDRAAWEVAMRAVRAEKGAPPDLDELLQGIALRPKEPPTNPDSVRLLTIHSAKGLQFRFVWLVGLVESILPSWQSLKPEASAAEMEEERRNCFVAITRTQEQLTLSYAHSYKGWAHPASRFIEEMQVANVSTSPS